MNPLLPESAAADGGGGPGRRRLLLAGAVTLFLGARLVPPSPGRADTGRGRLIYEARSAFSHIRVRDSGSRRTLYFVRDSGEEVVETSIDLGAPHLLQVEYTRVMFASLLYRPRTSSGLLVGLGGGAMVRFLNHFFPEVRLDVVEIDPVVVAVARTHFGLAPAAERRIAVEDAFQFLQRTTAQYDVIFMDAFLKPGPDTDATGVPLRLKTVSFLRSLHRRLGPDGLVVFNINLSAQTGEDIAAIRQAFAAVDVYEVTASGTVVVVAAPAGPMPGEAELRERARALDRAQDHGFSFRQLLAYRGRQR